MKHTDTFGKETKDAKEIWGVSEFINKSGKKVIRVSPDKDVESMFSEGFVVVKLYEGEYVFMDKTGKIRFDQKFRYAEPFSEGLALVER